MDTIFQALSHRVRREMIHRLTSGAMTVGALAEPFAISLEAASKHIKILERAGLVRRTVQGRRHVCRMEAAPLAKANDWLSFYERFWNEKLDALEGLLADTRRPGEEE